MIGDATTVIVTALADAVRAQSRTISLYLASALDGRVDALRRTRVASRRLRESLAVIAAVGLRVDTARIEREARRLTRALGPVREIDVALQQFDLAARRHRWPRDRRAAVRRSLETLRDRRRRRMTQSLRRFDRAALVARCRQAAEVITAATDMRAWWHALSERIRARATDVTNAIDACGTIYDPERLHTVRIAIKKLRYALEFAGGMPGIALADTIAALIHAQNRFGQLHDVQMLKADIEQLAMSHRRVMLRAMLRVMADDLERDCRVIHGEILPLLPSLRRTVLVVDRDVSVRSGNRRLPMVKARVLEDVVARHGRRPAHSIRSKSQTRG